MKASGIGPLNHNSCTPTVYLYRVYFCPTHTEKERVSVLSKPPRQLAIMSNNHPSCILITWLEPAKTTMPTVRNAKERWRYWFLVTRTEQNPRFNVFHIEWNDKSKIEYQPDRFTCRSIRNTHRHLYTNVLSFLKYNI